MTEKQAEYKTEQKEPIELTIHGLRLDRDVTGKHVLSICDPDTSETLACCTIEHSIGKAGLDIMPWAVLRWAEQQTPVKVPSYSEGTAEPTKLDNN